jgi:hypothetical protein
MDPSTPMPPAPELHSDSLGPLAAWDVGDLPAPPRFGWRRWTELIGPGVVVAGSAVGAGEWLFGPAVTAQYGGTFLWLATLSILFQVVYNLEVMRYALYCGEPIFIGYFRTRPGPRFWMVCYMTLFLAHIWPFMASNAAVPLAAAVLGHLPGDGVVWLAGFTLSEITVVKGLGYVVFVATLVPLVFGGKIATMLERLMTFKLVVVLGFLVGVGLLMVTPRDAYEIISGFFRLGAVAIRAETVIAAPHFSLLEREGSVEYLVQGTLEDDRPVVTAFVVRRGETRTRYGVGARLPEGGPLETRRIRMAEEAAARVRRGGFYVRSVVPVDGTQVSVAGTLGPGRDWLPAHVTLVRGSNARTYNRLEDVPEPYEALVKSWVANQGFQRVGLWDYWRRHRRLPDLDWSLLAAFAAIAGAGGLSNALFSNYARDKGWGMGARTGAIPSAIGGRSIELSHNGMAFPITTDNLERWRGWFRHIVRDQVVVWMTCCFLGLALPCMLSLEFLRNTPVSDHRVAAMVAEGMSVRLPAYSRTVWSLTLFVSFLTLAPCAVYSGDLLARHWTDILWATSPAVHRWKGQQVKYLYYGLLAVYAVWGSITLAVLSPLQIAKVGAVLGNVALGSSAFHTLFVNRTLVPRELRPNAFMQVGLVGCGMFFFAITAIVIVGR